MNDKIKIYKTSPLAKSKNGWYSRGYLPHFDKANTTQFVTIRLYDSMPQELLSQLEKELCNTQHISVSKERRKKIEAWLDAGIGSCMLKNFRVTTIIKEALLFLSSKSIILHAWVIMPNHIHILFTLNTEQSLSKVISSFKSFTALKANKLLKRKGAFWSQDYFDRFIRDSAHYYATLRYIEDNPVRAKLCNKKSAWIFSSASVYTETPTSPSADLEVSQR